jgi:hypothetical protein
LRQNSNHKEDKQMKLIKDMIGVVEGDVYPTDFKVGDEIPPELEDAAMALGAVEGSKSSTPKLTDALKAEAAAKAKAEADAAAAELEAKALAGAPENKSA